MFPVGFDEITGFCKNATDGELLTDVVKRVGISPAEDYFNGFVLGLNIGETGEKHTFENYGKIRKRRNTEIDNVTTDSSVTPIYCMGSQMKA
jgi:hypothetical protein